METIKLKKKEYVWKIGLWAIFFIPILIILISWPFNVTVIFTYVFLGIIVLAAYLKLTFTRIVYDSTKIIYYKGKKSIEIHMKDITKIIFKGQYKAGGDTFYAVMWLDINTKDNKVHKIWASDFAVDNFSKLLGAIKRNSSCEVSIDQLWLNRYTDWGKDNYIAAISWCLAIILSFTGLLLWAFLSK